MSLTKFCKESRPFRYSIRLQNNNEEFKDFDSEYLGLTRPDLEATPRPTAPLVVRGNKWIIRG
jgi:hypothetical protein